MHERRDRRVPAGTGDGETVPSNVEGMLYPIHPLQVTAMGMLAADSLQLEDVGPRRAPRRGGFEFMVVGLPLRLPGAHRVAVEPDRDLLGGNVRRLRGARSRW